MSRQRHQVVDVTVAPPAAAVKSDSVASGPMRLSGIARTANGYAVAIVELTADGRVISIKLGPSQTVKEYVAIEHKRIAVRLSQAA